MENLPHKTAVLFMDAVHPEHNNRPTLAWIKPEQKSTCQPTRPANESILMGSIIQSLKRLSFATSQL